MKLFLINLLGMYKYIIYLSYRHPVTTILASALIFRVLGMLIFKSYVDPSENEMGVMAKNILAGKGMSIAYFGPERITTSFSPFEAYFYALMHYLFGYSKISYALIILIRSLFSIATAYIVFLIAKMVFSKRVAYLALIGTAFHPSLIYYSAINTNLVRSPFSVFSISLVVLSLVWFSRDPNLRRSAIVGAIFGISCLIQSNTLAFIAFALLWMMYVIWQRFHNVFSVSSIRVLISMPLALVLVVSPWTIRNYLATGEFVLIRAGFGTYFWASNNPDVTDVSKVMPLPLEEINIPGTNTLDPVLKKKIQYASDKERDYILLNEAFRFISHNPERYFDLSKQRFINYWLGPNKTRASSIKKIFDYMFSGVSILMLSFAISIFFFQRDKYIVLFVLLISSYTGFYSLINASFHYYRMDIEPYLIVLALMTLLALWDRHIVPRYN